MRAVPRTIPELLAARAAADPSRIAIEVPRVGALSFADWQARATAVATGLLDRGLRWGDRVVLSFPLRDWLDFAVAYCGVQVAGGVAVPCSDRLPPAGLRHILADSGAVGIVRPAGAYVSIVDDSVWFATVGDLERAGTDAPADAVGPEDLAQILYTSGTTGRPKGVAASHANLTFGVAIHPRRRALAHSEHFLHAFPIGTNAGQTMLRNALDAWPAALVLPRFTPDRFVRAATDYGAGTAFVVPAMAIELVNSGALRGHNLPDLVLLGSTASALPPTVALRLAELLPATTIVNYYTSTEAAPAQLSMVFDPDRPDSVGRAVDGSVRITDADGRPVAPDAAGEVWLRCPHPRRYHGDAAANRETFRDGWVRMGDLGRLDAQGYLYLLDRQADVIKSGADKVSTLQVETALYEHPDVVDAAVVGIPHPVLGATAAAAVTLRTPGAPLDLPALRLFLSERLATHELPTRIVVLDQLPRNAGGKVVKREVLALLAGPAADGAAEPAAGQPAAIEGPIVGGTSR